MAKYINFQGNKLKLNPSENRKTFTFVAEYRFRCPELYLVKQLDYKNCIGIRRKKYIAVCIEKYLISKYNLVRRKNRLYLKNYKKALRNGADYKRI